MTVYVLSTDDSGTYKIGYTDYWPRREKDYASHAYRHTVHFLDHEADRTDERFLMRLFEDKAAPLSGSRHEWFILESSDLALLKTLSAGPGLCSVYALEGYGLRLRKLVHAYVEAWDANLAR